MRFNKRGAELSINVIILAALGVLVLLILIAVFSRNIGQTTKKLEGAGSGPEKVKVILTSKQISISELLSQTSIENVNSKLDSEGVGAMLRAVGDPSTIGKTKEDCLYIGKVNGKEECYICPI